VVAHNLPYADYNYYFRESTQEALCTKSTATLAGLELRYIQREPKHLRARRCHY